MDLLKPSCNFFVDGIFGPFLRSSEGDRSTAINLQSPELKDEITSVEIKMNVIDCAVKSFQLRNI